MRGILILAVTSIFLMAMFGCSGSSEVVVPEDNPPALAQSTDSHQLWGMWQFVADPEAQTLDVVQLRGMEMHLNALPFLEPPALVNLTLESIEFNGNIITADIGLRHPFLGLTEFTGFDVSGIFITNGSVSGFTDSDIVMPGDGDTRLLNPDGYSRWWNPNEYPDDSTIFGYTDGLLGAPDSFADYNCTVNGYKYYSDSLETADNIGDLDPSDLGIFSAGQKNVRRFEIELGTEGLIFNYAIDANWQFPIGTPPWSVPQSFDENAWRTEAWNFTVTNIDNTLWNDGTENGGDLGLSIEVWDHFDADANIVYIESPGNFPITSSDTATGGGDGYSTYEIEILDATPAPDAIDLFITVETPVAGGEPIRTYFTYDDVPVDDDSGEPPECGSGNHGPMVPAPITDSGSVTRFDLAWLVNGPYEGEMLTSGWNGTVNELRRYNTDTIGPLSGNVFATLPLVACPPAPPPYTFPPFLTHIEVEPVTGRVIVVPFGPEANNSLHIFDNQGNQLTPDIGISVGAGRRISAMGTNENGDIWLISTLQLSYSYGDDCRLQRWEYQSGSPYYVHDSSHDLELDEVMGFYYNDTYEYVVNNWIVDLVVLYPEQRIFVWHSSSFAQHNGRLDLFDINSSGPPTYLPTLSTENLLSLGTWNSHTDYFTVESAGISVDHADDTLDGCRVSVFSLCRIEPGTRPLLLARLDRDGVVLNETNFGTGYSAYTMGINHDPDPMKANLVFTSYNPSSCRMAAPPSDW